ncbi:hypothetical protein EA658_13950 [Pseudoxanthomonas winnipegensis]|uniref:DUF1902 domain-containing protein n=1 Tax=Pseudoxanthomonas winnipegensis TaxID=2480810 RepID=A0ABY1WB54_9GAMM|nr:hypothetical protein [Pseudoxanthomonas winnipegensis]TAA18242.1 hypothetical protein EA658_13950 [Pseudoxanthomonas winnipegensis]
MSTLEFRVEIRTEGARQTLVAELRHGPLGAWYHSEVDIVPPVSAMDLPNALRALGDELERNLSHATDPVAGIAT